MSENQTDQVYTLRLVSHSINSTVMKNIKNVNIYSKADTIDQFFQDNNSIETVNFIQVKKLKDIQQFVDLIETGRLNHIQELNFSQSRLGDHDMSLLLKSLQTSCSNHIHILNLSNNACSNATSKQLGICISKGCLKEIEEIILTRNLIFAGGIENICRSFMNYSCQRLQRLSLTHCHLGDRGVEILMNSLQASPFISIKVLELADNGITWIGVKYIYQTSLYGRLFHLAVLDLSNNPIMEKGIQFLVKALVGNRTLTQSYPDMLASSSGTGTQSLLSTFSGCPNLQSLLLHSCNLNSRSIYSFSSLFGYLLHLSILSLSNNNIGDRGVYFLFSSLAPSSIPLQVLDLNDTHLTSDAYNNLEDRGLCILINSLKENHFQHLKTLYINKIKLTSKGSQIFYSFIREQTIYKNLNIYIGENKLSKQNISHLYNLLNNLNDNTQSIPPCKVINCDKGIKIPLKELVYINKPKISTKPISHVVAQPLQIANKPDVSFYSYLNTFSSEDLYAVHTPPAA
ncbi:hypothetical protein WA158_000146 [Blastocystis sp. Blastoise]